MDGLKLREQIQADKALRQKSISFVFLLQDIRQEVVNRTYDLTVQGFIEKADPVDGVERQLKSIVDYWQACRHPNT
jgi:DNA-binding NarL/FixJ family response regulator